MWVSRVEPLSFRNLADEPVELAPGLTVVPGMELSCRWFPDDQPPISVHLLGYLFDPLAPAFLAERARLRDERLSRGERIATALADDGHPVVWDEIVERHSDRVFRLAYRLTGNRADAEDLTQEVFVRVFRSLATYTPGTFEGWMHRITTNLFLDQTRRKKRVRIDALTPDASERLPDLGPGPEREFERLNLDTDVRAALAALSPQFRAVVVLAGRAGLPAAGTNHAGAEPFSTAIRTSRVS